MDDNNASEYVERITKELLCCYSNIEPDEARFLAMRLEDATYRAIGVAIEAQAEKTGALQQIQDMLPWNKEVKINEQEASLPDA